MESATIAANGFRFRVPYGTLLCVSDKPLHGEIKLPGMANHFYRERVDQHLRIGMRADGVAAPRACRAACTAASCAALPKWPSSNANELMGSPGVPWLERSSADWRPWGCRSLRSQGVRLASRPGDPEPVPQRYSPLSARNGAASPSAHCQASLNGAIAGIDSIRTLALVGPAASGKTLPGRSACCTRPVEPLALMGSLERGGTVSDYDPLEKRMQHSLNASIVMHLDHAGTRVHFIDTPGGARLPRSKPASAGGSGNRGHRHQRQPPASSRWPCA